MGASSLIITLLMAYIFKHKSIYHLIKNLNCKKKCFIYHSFFFIDFSSCLLYLFLQVDVTRGDDQRSHCVSECEVGGKKFTLEQNEFGTAFYNLTYSLLNLPGKENWTDKQSPAYYLQR